MEKMQDQADSFETNPSEGEGGRKPAEESNVPEGNEGQNYGGNAEPAETASGSSEEDKVVGDASHCPASSSSLVTADVPAEETPHDENNCQSIDFIVATCKNVTVYAPVRETPSVDGFTSPSEPELGSDACRTQLASATDRGRKDEDASTVVVDFSPCATPSASDSASSSKINDSEAVCGSLLTPPLPPSSPSPASPQPPLPPLSSYFALVESDGWIDNSPTLSETGMDNFMPCGIYSSPLTLESPSTPAQVPPSSPPPLYSPSSFNSVPEVDFLIKDFFSWTISETRMDNFTLSGSNSSPNALESPPTPAQVPPSSPPPLSPPSATQPSAPPLPLSLPQLSPSPLSPSPLSPPSSFDSIPEGEFWIEDLSSWMTSETLVNNFALCDDYPSPPIPGHVPPPTPPCRGKKRPRPLLGLFTSQPSMRANVSIRPRRADVARRPRRAARIPERGWCDRGTLLQFIITVTVLGPYLIFGHLLPWLRSLL